ncbi:MAG TPA: hypothetical protein PKD09_08790 [Aggregatilinea sp.]|uniref:hypothetical protein n=1 Tax=Aggregatilinea sp. TaxID=2806333 RepID=UPI002C402886|nr:hypothetical protein [Aggregatilinea sp.]HML21730.1 hypothetical protein [Aggregatilinea sp.]
MSKVAKFLLLPLILMLVLSGGFAFGAPRAHAAVSLCPIISQSGTASPSTPPIEYATVVLQEGTIVHYEVSASVASLLVFQSASMTGLSGTIEQRLADTSMLGTIVISATGTYQMMAGLLPSADSTFTISVTYECGEPDAVVSASAWGPACPAVLDGRVNADPAQDCAAPVAVFPKRGGYEIYDPASSSGPVLVVTARQIANAGVPTGENVLLGESVLGDGRTVQLYRLTTGEFSLITTYPDGKSYIVVWNTAGGVHHDAS